MLLLMHQLKMEKNIQVLSLGQRTIFLWVLAVICWSMTESSAPGGPALTFPTSMVLGMLVRACCVRQRSNLGGHYFGPSRVRALPLAAGINVGGHYFW